MKNVLNTIIPILLTISYISGGEISANLATEINVTSPDSLIRVLINLEERFDAQSLSYSMQQQGATRQEIHQAVIEGLKAVAESSQSDIISTLGRE